jgi:MFS family permease
VILLASTIGAAVQNSYEAQLAMRIIQGLSTGAPESLLPLMITEITFLHQRSQLFPYYWTPQTA